MSDARDVVGHLLASLQPTPRIDPAAWAESNRQLPSSVASRPGPYRLDDLPMLREPLSHLSVHSPTTQIAVMKAAQMGWSEMALSALGYWLDLAPGPAMVVQPTDEALDLFVHQRVRALLRHTPTLMGKLATMPGRSADSLKTLELPGSIVKFASAASEADLQSMPVRYIIADEVDRWPASVGRSGDPVDVIRARTTTYEGRQKLIYISTPSVHGRSRIETAYIEGDQREWCVPCPHCGTMQTLRPERLRWEPGAYSRVTYTCEHCECDIDEAAKSEMNRLGEWRPRNPEAAYPSYWISGLSRPAGWMGWRAIAQQWDSARKDPERMRPLVNLQFGLAHEEQSTQAFAYGDLATRRERYRADCPAGVYVLTAGVDSQTGDAELGQRLEVEIVGWGSGQESWSVAHHRVMGRLDDPETWRRLAVILSATYTHELDKRGLVVSAVCIDTGGHFAQQVHDFLRPHYAAQRRWYAVKGIAGESRPVWPTRQKFSRRFNAPLWLVGMDGAKRLAAERLTIQAPGPGYCHVPHDRPDEWFRQLTSERLEYSLVKGRPTARWVLPAHRRNEALDCRCYAYAALCSLESEGLALDAIVAERKQLRQDASVAHHVPPPRKLAPARVRSGWGRHV